jgi:hypothetical protein
MIGTSYQVLRLVLLRVEIVLRCGVRGLGEYITVVVLAP